MAINRYVKKAGMLVGMLGIIAGCFQGYRAYAEDVTQKRHQRRSISRFIN